MDRKVTWLKSFTAIINCHWWCQETTSRRKCVFAEKKSPDNLYPLELYLATSELLFCQEQEGILPELLSSSGIV